MFHKFIHTFCRTCNCLCWLVCLTTIGILLHHGVSVLSKFSIHVELNLSMRMHVQWAVSNCATSVVQHLSINSTYVLWPHCHSSRTDVSWLVLWQCCACWYSCMTFCWTGSSLCWTRLHSLFIVLDHMITSRCYSIIYIGFEFGTVLHVCIGSVSTTLRWRIWRWLFHIQLIPVSDQTFPVAAVWIWNSLLLYVTLLLSLASSYLQA